MAELNLEAIEARSAASVKMQGTGVYVLYLEATADDVPALVAEVRRLRRWKAEALPVMVGLQGVGGALGLTLGTSITGRAAAEAARALTARAEAAEAQRDVALAKVAAVEALATKFEGWPSGPSYAVTAKAIRAALATGEGK